MAYCLAVPLDSGTNNAASLKVGGYNLFEYVPGVTSDTVSNMVAALRETLAGAGSVVMGNFTSVVCGYLSFTNGGVRYSLVVSTNLP
jgi:hypothetical protein